LSDCEGSDDLQPLHTYPHSNGDGPHLQFLKQELKAVVTEAVDRLGPKERLVVSLYYFDELTMKEIAAVLGVNESRVSQIHTKAMSQLRRKLKNSGYNPSAQGTNLPPEAQDEIRADNPGSTTQRRQPVSPAHR